MAKTAKITVSLPKPILTWLQDEARKRFVSTPEQIRTFIVDVYNQAQLNESPGFSPNKHGSPPAVGSLNHLKTPTQSGFKGVYPYSNKRWQAVVNHRGRRTRVGVYDSPEEAARAYDTAMVTKYGDPHAAANAVAAKQQEAALIDAPFVAKLQRGEKLTDVEMATWRRMSNAVTTASSTLPVTSTPSTPMPDEDNAPIANPVRRQLRRGPGPSIDRPVDDSPQHEDA